MCKTCGHIESIPTYWTPTAGLGDYIQKIFDCLLKAGKIDKEQVESTFNTLYKGVEKGYGKKLINLDYETPDAKKLAFMQRNVFVFSAYKSYQNVVEVNKALYDDKGNIRPFSEFKKLATTIDEAFNKRYLETEYNLSVLSGRAASQWQEFESMADTYPLLQYQTIGDSNVRPEHAQLDGVIRPINDAFWRTFYPPNDWGCRCDVIQVTDEDAKPTPKENISTPEMKEIFKNNVGITGKVFPDSHPYFDVLKEHQNDANNLWGLDLPQNEGKKSVDLQDGKNKDILKLIHTGKNGGYLKVSSKADSTDYEKNLDAAKTLANNGYRVIINRHFKKGNPETGKNAEYMVNEEMSDLKTPTKPTSIKSTFSNAEKQLINEFVCKLELPHTENQIIDGVQLGFFHNKLIQKVIFIKNENVVQITRNQWIDGSFKIEIKKLK